MANAHVTVGVDHAFVGDDAVGHDEITDGPLTVGHILSIARDLP
jgi:hypothetical protein